MSIQKIKNSFNFGNKYKIQEKLILDFLNKHKTKKCQNCKNKKQEFKCSGFHDSQDFRRKQGQKQRYDIKMCKQGINCKDFTKCLELAKKGEDYEISCLKSHNYYEIMYNYDYYRLQQCPHYYKCESSLQQLCPYYHSIDDQREIQEILYRKKLRQDITYEIINIQEMLKKLELYVIDIFDLLNSSINQENSYDANMSLLNNNQNQIIDLTSSTIKDDQDQSGYLKQAIQLENEQISNDNKIKDQSQINKVQNYQYNQNDSQILKFKPKNDEIYEQDQNKFYMEEQNSSVQSLQKQNKKLDILSENGLTEKVEQQNIENKKNKKKNKRKRKQSQLNNINMQSDYQYIQKIDDFDHLKQQQLNNNGYINGSILNQEKDEKKSSGDSYTQYKNQVIEKKDNIQNIQEENIDKQRDFLSKNCNFQCNSNGYIQNNQIIEETEKNEIKLEKIIDPKIKQNLDKKQNYLKQKINRKKFNPREDEEDDDDEDDLDDEQQQQLNGLQKNNFQNNNKNIGHNQEINQRIEQDNNSDKNKKFQEQLQNSKTKNVNEEQEIQTRYSYIQKQVFEENNGQNTEKQKQQNEKNLKLQKSNSNDLNNEDDKQKKNNDIFKNDDNQHKEINDNNSDVKEKVKLDGDGKIQEQIQEFQDKNNVGDQNNSIVQDQQDVANNGNIDQGNFQENQNMINNQNMILQQHQQNNNREDSFIQEQDRTFVSIQEQQTHLQLLKIQKEHKEQQKIISVLQKQVLEIQNQNLERNSHLYSQKKSQLKLDNNLNDDENEVIDNNTIVQCDIQKEVKCQDIINRICGIFNNGAIQDEIIDLQYQIKYSFFKGKRMDHAYKLIQNIKNQLGNCSKSIQIKNSVEIKLKDEEHNVQQIEIKNDQLNNESTYFSLYFSVYIKKKNMKNIFKNQHDLENLKILNNFQQYFFAFNTTDYQEIKDEYQQLELQYSQNVIRIENDYKIQLQEANKKILEKDQKIDDLEQQIKKKDLMIEKLIFQSFQQKN